MKATLYVEPECEAGLNRGGEDLSLVFTCEVAGGEPPTEFDVVFCPAGDDYDGVDVEISGDDGTTEIKARFETHHYEFEWEGTAAEALALVKDKFLDAANWCFCHAVGTEQRLRFEYSHYVGGNAD